MRLFRFAATALLLLRNARAESILYPRVTIFYQPLTGGRSLPLASIEYESFPVYNRVFSYTPPAAGDTTNEAETSHPLFRISIGPSGESTTITSLSTFNPKYTQTITLHLDDDDSVFSASLSADPLTPPSTSETPADSLKVVLLKSKPGPSPKLNTRKPVVIGEDGKEIPQTPEVEKSFFQKYWWALGLVAMAALVGSGEK